MANPRPITTAPYVEHANGFTARPTIDGKRWFIGYWPTEKKAVQAANDFIKLAKRLEPEELKAAAERFKAAAQEERDTRREKIAEANANKPPRMPRRPNVRKILEQHEREINALHQRINEIERKLAQ